MGQLVCAMIQLSIGNPLVSQAYGFGLWTQLCLALKKIHETDVDCMLGFSSAFDYQLRFLFNAQQRRLREVLVRAFPHSTHHVSDVSEQTIGGRRSEQIRAVFEH